MLEIVFINWYRKKHLMVDGTITKQEVVNIVSQEKVSTDQESKLTYICLYLSSNDFRCD